MRYVKQNTAHKLKAVIGFWQIISSEHKKIHILDSCQSENLKRISWLVLIDARIDSVPSTNPLSLPLTLVFEGRRWGGMPEGIRCWTSPAESTPAQQPPWWRWRPGIAHSPPYLSLGGGGEERRNVRRQKEQVAKLEIIIKGQIKTICRRKALALWNKPTQFMVYFVKATWSYKKDTGCN